MGGAANPPACCTSPSSPPMPSGLCKMVLSLVLILSADEMEDTQWRNNRHRGRDIIATSKVRAAITILDMPPGDISSLSCL